MYEMERNSLINIEKHDIESHKTKKLTKTLNDIYRQADRIEMNKRIKPIEIFNRPSKRLICINELNITPVAIQDPFMEAK